MIDMSEIEMEINRLESEELNYPNAGKLADLYVVRDHFKGTVDASYSYGESEFLQLCSACSVDDLLHVIDEHMEMLKVLHPKEYSVILLKIRNLT